jgi:hypothetical protein
MRRPSSSLIVFAVLAATVGIASAGTCEEEIERLQSEAANSSGRTISGPTAPQSIGAQLSHQPTPATVERAQREAESRFADLLAHARILGSEGNSTACLKVVTDARQMLVLK